MASLAEALGAAATGAGIQQAPIVAPATVPAAQPQSAGLLSSLLGPQYAPMVRSFAAGLANMQEGIDPYVAFGRGLGGSQQYYQSEADKARAAQLEAQKTAYQQQQDALQNARADKSLSLQEQNYSADNARADAASKRTDIQFQQQQDALAAETKRLAENNGLTDEDIRNIEDNAASAALKAAKTGDDYSVDGTGGQIDPVKYQQTYTQIRDTMIQARTAAKAPGVGPGVSGDPAAVPTATGPNGQKIKLVNGQWVPAE